MRFIRSLLLMLYFIVYTTPYAIALALNAVAVLLVVAGVLFLQPS